MEAGRFPVNVAKNAGGSFRLDGKNAVITGAGSGIGQAIAFRFAAQGAKIHVVDLNEHAAKETSEKIGSESGAASYHICDVTSQSAVKSTFEQLFRQERIHVLVNKDRKSVV